MDDFFKYPECEPLKSGSYLCVCYDASYDQKYFFQWIQFTPIRGFMSPFEVVAYSATTPAEAYKNAQIWKKETKY